MSENDVLLNKHLVYTHLCALCAHREIPYPTLRCKYPKFQVLIRYFSNGLSASLVAVERSSSRNVVSRTDVDQVAGASLAHRIAGGVDNCGDRSARGGGAVGLMREAMQGLKISRRNT